MASGLQEEGKKTNDELEHLEDIALVGNIAVLLDWVVAE